MGNVHVLGQRFPALTAACISSVALAFMAIAGTTCSFVDVKANEDRFILSTNDGFQTSATFASFGVLCETDFFDSDGDTMWEVSQGFLYVSLAIGALATVLAWVLTWIIPTTDDNWKMLSILSALTAVLNVPVFLIFESRPCNIDASRQQCSLSFGCYILIASIVFSIGVTLLTQVIDPPRWADELDAWKVKKRNEEEAALSLSRDIVASDEYGEDEEAPPAQQAASTVGVVEGFQRWNMRRKWAQSSADLKKSDTFPVSQDEEEVLNVELPEGQSYYANSNNSRLLLKVTPDGERPGDDQKSMTSLGDLDDYVKMAEEERDGDEMSFGSEEEENEMLANGDEQLVILPREGSLHSSPEKQAVETFTDDSIGSRHSSPQKRPVQTFTDESIYYSEMKPPPCDKEEESLLDEREEGKDDEEDDPRSKISMGIRSLTNRVLRDASRRVTSGKSYAMMDDDDDDIDDQAEEYVPPSGSIPLPSSGDRSSTFDEYNGIKAVVADSDHLLHQKLIYDWNALHAAASAGILLAHEQNSDSSSEDDPEPVFYTTSDESSKSAMSTSSHGADGDDGESAFSDSTLSDSSDKEDLPASGIVLMARPRKDRRRRRSSKKDFSSVHSSSSYTSVLDMTIDEETDIDLKEFDSSEDELMGKAHPGGYTSAPETKRRGGRGLSFGYDTVRSESLPATERGYIIPKAKSSDSGHSSDSSRSSAMEQPTSISQVSPVSVDARAEVGRQPSIAAPDRSEEIWIDTQKLKRYAPSADEEENYLYRPNPRRCRSMSIPRRKKLSSIHPLFTPPRSSASSISSLGDTPDTKTTMEETADIIPWREERLYKAGIHSDAIHIVSDDDNSDELYMSEPSARSVKSCMSRTARKARIRRLQRELVESTSQRQRSRTLDPPKNRRRQEMQYDLPGGRRELRYDLPVRNNATLNRLLFGNDHGPDELSL